MKLAKELKWQQIIMCNEREKISSHNICFHCFCLSMNWQWVASLLSFSSIKFNEKLASAAYTKRHTFVRAMWGELILTVVISQQPTCDIRNEISPILNYLLILSPQTSDTFGIFNINKERKKQKVFIWVDWLIVLIVPTNEHILSSLFFVHFYSI